MDGINRVKLARYCNRRGLLMLKCAKGCELKHHKDTFKRLAKRHFDARDFHMSIARGGL